MAQTWSHIAEGSNEGSSGLQSGWERRNRAWARLTAAAARGDASAWRHLVTVHSTPLWHFALDCGLSEDQAEQACELAWLRAAQLLEERPHVGRAFGHTLRAVVVDEAHRSREGRGVPDHRPRLDLVPDDLPEGADKRSITRRSTLAQDRRAADDGTPPAAEKRAADRRRTTRGAGGQVSPPYFDAFERIANALEGIEDALREQGLVGSDRTGEEQYPTEPARPAATPIVLPGSEALGTAHPRP